MKKRKNYEVARGLGDILPLQVIQKMGSILSDEVLTEEDAKRQAHRLAKPSMDFAGLAEAYGVSGKREATSLSVSNMHPRHSCISLENTPGWEYSAEGPVFLGAYQSSLHESGGWDGYNTSKVSLVFLTMARADPPKGTWLASKPVVLFGHFHFDGKVSEIQAGVPLCGDELASISYGIAENTEELRLIASLMDIDGYGAKACTQLLVDCPIQDMDWVNLLNPQHYEREDIDVATAPASPGKTSSARRKAI